MNEEKIIIAGPCSVESEKQAFSIAQNLYELGVRYFRGGAYKPRTRKASFEGLGEQGLKILKKIKDKFGFFIVSEIMSEKDLYLFKKYDIDYLQIGARNMQNFKLLDAISKTDFKVILKRGLSADFEEISGAIERLSKNEIIFCLRGLKIMKTNNSEVDSNIEKILIENNKWQKKNYRNYVDIEDIKKLKQLDIFKNIPIIFDPSHACGISEDVEFLSKEAIKNGADGLMIEVHNNPDIALSDSKQQIKPDVFKNIYSNIFNLN